MGFVLTTPPSKEFRCNGVHGVKHIQKNGSSIKHAVTNGTVGKNQAVHDDSPTLAPLSGIRAFASVTIVCIHVAHWVNLSIGDRKKVHGAFETSAWWNYLYQPDPPMDAFLTLTGFLAAWSLIPALEHTSGYYKTIKRYYLKRIWHIVPPYYLFLGGLYFFLMPVASNPSLHGDLWRGFFDRFATMDQGACATLLWRNFTFTNNMVDFAGCWNITWSLCVQMQFYAAFPLALLALQPQKPGFRKRVVALCITIIAGVSCYKTWQMFHTQLWTYMPLAAFDQSIVRVNKLMIFMGHHSYTNFVSRLSALGMGVLAALALSDQHFRHWLGRNRATTYQVWVGLFLVLAGSGIVNKFGCEPDPNHISASIPGLFFVFVLTQTFLSPFFYAIMLAVVMTRQPGLGRFLSRLLSAKLLAWLADLSYDIYLIHSFVIFGIWTVYPPSVWWDVRKPSTFIAVFCAAFALTTMLAWLHNRLWAAVRSAASKITLSVLKQKTV